jgi:hypothetical protein
MSLLTDSLEMQLHDSLGNPISQTEAADVVVNVEDARATAVIETVEHGRWRVELTPAVSHGFIEYTVLVNGSLISPGPQRVEVIATALTEKIRIQDGESEGFDGFRHVSLASRYVFRLIGHRNVMWRLTSNDILITATGGNLLA